VDLLTKLQGLIASGHALGDVLLGYLASMGSRLVIQKKLKSSSSALADCAPASPTSTQ
jgi:hypothetical protein